MPRYLPLLVLLVGSLSCSIPSQEREIVPVFPTPAAFYGPGVNEFSGNVALQNNLQSNQSVSANTYRVNFGPQVVTVRASYRENADPAIGASGNLEPATAQQYFDLRAASAVAGTNLLTEGEMTYNLLGPSDGNVKPAMFRLGVRNRWQGLSYGADYKSVQQGFTSIGGTFADQSRDDAVIWGEHGLGAFKLRGSVGESWERMADPADLRVTRMAATSLQIKRGVWGGSLSASYGLVEQGSGSKTESRLLIRTLAGSYRASDSFLLEPNFSLKEEWDQSTGVRTQTPASAMAFTYSPARSAFRLTGSTSFTRVFGGDEFHGAGVHGTSAALDWKLGKILGRDDRLLFTFSYNRHLDHFSGNNAQRYLTGMLQLRVAGF
jgi:hypothetical protein